MISSTKFSDDRVREIRKHCETAGVGLRRMRIVIEEVGGGGDEA